MNIDAPFSPGTATMYFYLYLQINDEIL